MRRSLIHLSLSFLSSLALLSPVSSALQSGVSHSRLQRRPLPTRPFPNPVHDGPRRTWPQSTNTATSTTLTVSAGSVNAGVAVTLTAKVAAGATSVAPGIVLFCNAAAPPCVGASVLATGVLSTQGTTARTLMLPVGSYSVAAEFQGTAPYAASASAPVSVTVEGSGSYATKSTLTAVTGSNGVYALGASLSTHAPAAPTGELVFADTTNNRTLGSAALNDVPLGGYQPFGLISTGAKSGPNDLVTGDFNNDGIPDLAVPDSATGVVAVFLGKGDATFAPAVTYSTGIGSQPLALAVGDFNGDGNQDLAVALGNQAAVAILLGNGDGTFRPPLTVATASTSLYYPLALAVGDFNHDGRMDIATANNSQGVSVLLGNGDGTFQQYKPLGSSQGPSWVAAGDFNNDGVPDLAVTTGSGTVDISLGNGDGSFETYTAVSTGACANPQSVAAADFDGDGNLDLAVACYGANALGVMLGNGDGTFLPVELYVAGAAPIAVAIGDLNLDGIPDIVVTNLTSNTLSLYQGNGDGTFLPLPGYTTTSGSQPAATVIADLNAEGTPELATALYGSSALYVLQTVRTQGVVLKDVTLSTAGTIDLTAAYAGDSLYAAATSTPYAFTGSATTAVAPVFSPVAGTYTSAQTVTLTSTAPTAQIYYTLDGSVPTTASNIYGTPIPVATSVTIAAIAVATGFTNSSVATAAYVIESPAAAPVFSPPAGIYSSAQSVTLTSTTPGATIYYTLNGSTPTTASARYTGAIAISSDTTITAIATASGFESSSAVSAAYTIKAGGATPHRRRRSRRPFQIASVPGLARRGSGAPSQPPGRIEPVVP